MVGSLEKGSGLLYTREFTLVKSCVSALDVGNVLAIDQISVYIREFTLEQDLMNSVNMGRH